MRRASAVAILILTLVLSSNGFGCQRCESSPNGWGFCRAGFERGTMWCEGYTSDPFNGTQKCRISGWDCYNGGNRVDGGGCDWPNCEYFEQMAEKDPCSWTDTEAIRLV
jgi:hypothetical protein